MAVENMLILVPRPVNLYFAPYKYLIVMLLWLIHLTF